VAGVCNAGGHAGSWKRRIEDGGWKMEDGEWRIAALPSSIFNPLSSILYLLPNKRHSG